VSKTPIKDAVRKANLKIFDWGEALRRNPDFRQECDAALNTFLQNRPEFKGCEPHNSDVLTAFRDYSQEARTLAETWNLGEPWHYLAPEPPYFPQYLYTTKIIPRKKTEYSCYQRANDLFSDRFLRIEIDLTKPLNLILADITRHYHRYERKNKGRGMEYDGNVKMWRAFDLINQGLTEIQTTWALFPATNGRSPSVNLETDKQLKQIKRWIAKAKALISETSYLKN
jgi:hypothetical protein